ncbi:hypothetical protein OESDEN_15473 [Oesophagostomum dentatum]|uniref:Uncharacterized protein n=1 Tax=Oesophagostomum dentatum TaxID=61180 RepID=A0A0B1SHJ5_OESDE|nr:hypothetical protein OESDEN_15473 [Oesophagostomum dentatum]
MKEIKELTKEWQDNFKDGVASLKDKTTKKEIKKALEDLISKFDRVNLQLVRNAVLNGTDTDSDMASSCDPITIDELDESVGTQPVSSSHPEDAKDQQHKFDRARKRIDEVKEHVIVEDGVEKLILSGSDGDATADMSMDSADASVQVDEKPSQKSKDSEEIQDWSSEEYKRELAKYKKERHLNVTTEPVGCLAT